MYNCEFCNFKTDKKFNHKRHLQTKSHIMKKDECKNSVNFIFNKINNLLKLAKEEKKDPNKYFNYKYYAINIKQLDIEELNDFILELETLFNF